MDCSVFVSSQAKVNYLSWMLLVVISNVQLLELFRQLVPFVTMK